MEILLRKCVFIGPHKGAGEDNEITQFEAAIVDQTFIVGKESGEVQVEVYDKQKLRGVLKVGVSAEVINALKAGQRLKDWPSEEAEKFKAIDRDLGDALRMTADAIKFYNCYHDLSDSYALMGSGWSSDGETWKAAPSWEEPDPLEWSVPNADHADAVEFVRDLLREKSLPLIHALRHLHHARRERAPQHQWINATVAAELAIKEFLILRKPEMETFILQIPSPPVGKMYGAVLKSLVGEESPHRRALEKGAERRNILVHRPVAERITKQEAIDYCAKVEAAIFHLLSHIFPNRTFVKYVMEATVDHITSEQSSGKSRANRP